MTAEEWKKKVKVTSSTSKETDIEPVKNKKTGIMTKSNLTSAFPHDNSHIY